MANTNKNTGKSVEMYVAANSVKGLLEFGNVYNSEQEALACAITDLDVEPDDNVYIAKVVISDATEYNVRVKLDVNSRISAASVLEDVTKRVD